MLKYEYTGNGKVVLIAGGGKIYTDIAARFVKSERPLEEIIASPYSKTIVDNILTCGHKAALEFDFFLFGVEGFSRVTEIQLVRKRLASYLIKSGRPDLSGKRLFSIVYPEKIANFAAPVSIPIEFCSTSSGKPLINNVKNSDDITVHVNTRLLAEITEQWYETGVQLGLPEEDLRYMKPQATEFKAIIGMNAHALHDWFSIRCCLNAQEEIRDLATKMLRLCRNVAPDLFQNSGASCLQLGYCPENKAQNKHCVGKTVTKEEALRILRDHRRANANNT